MSVTAFLNALDQRAAQARPVQFWLRDDDATHPSAALDRLLSMTEAAAVPVTLAVIPATTGTELATRLDQARDVTVAVHGWSHENHGPADGDKQELGMDRPLPILCDELAAGFAKLSALHPQRFLPLMVPPWNRIHPQVTAALPALGFQALSVFGPETPVACQAAAPLHLVNTHVDLIDWRGGRQGRPDDAVLAGLANATRRCPGPIGVMTHHLVHDAQVWGMMTRLFELTANHPGCQWISMREILKSP